MAPRPRVPGSGTLDYNRLAARIESAIEGSTVRFEQLFDGVDERLARVERDIASDALEKGNLVREMAEMRRDFGELRDLVNLHQDAPAAAVAEHVAAEVRHAAKGVAAEALEAAQMVAAAAAETADKTPRGAFWSSWKGYAVAVGAGLAGGKAALDSLPAVLTFIENLWNFLKGKGG